MKSESVCAAFPAPRDRLASVQAKRWRAEIQAAHPSKLDGVVSRLYAAHLAGELTDDEAEALHAKAEAARGRPPAPAAPKRRSVGSRPRTSASIPRRRRWGDEGWLPGEFAVAFTTSEKAALAVIAEEWSKSGVCRLFLDAVAAVAGTCKTMVRAAVRKAVDLGLISSAEVRRTAWRNDANEVRIVHPVWRRWLHRRPARKRRGAAATARERREAIERENGRRRSARAPMGGTPPTAQRVDRPAAEGGGGSNFVRSTTEPFLWKESSAAPRRSEVEICPSGSSFSGAGRSAPRSGTESSMN